MQELSRFEVIEKWTLLNRLIEERLKLCKMSKKKYKKGEPSIEYTISSVVDQTNARITKSQSDHADISTRKTVAVAFIAISLFLSLVLD